MPVDDLPMYPTPQQAAYVVDNHPKKSSKPPSSSSNYRPAVKASHSYGQPQQGYPPQAQHHYPPQQQQQHHQYPPPQQQPYYPQPAPAPPIPQQQPHYPPPPPPQQYHSAPPPQQYSQPPASRQQSYYQGGPPPPQQYQQPVPQHPQHQYNQDYNQSQPPVQQNLSASSQKYSYSGSSINGNNSLNQPPPHTPTAQSMHKKPPPGSTPSSQSMNKSNKSKESLNDQSNGQTSNKISSKQKLENELRSVFEKVDTNRSGRISAKELSLALLNFDNTRFQTSTVVLMIKLFSNPEAPSKSLNFDQFVLLWKHLSAYKKLFIQADSNKSGDISFGEFQKILTEIGYKLDIDVVLHLFSRFSYKEEGRYDQGNGVGKLKFDAFIELLVYLKKLTDVFKRYDKNLSGEATISFSNFLFEVSNLS
ncbi:uncharacterized protein RJT20DRAFT_38799 [Scheffersomyces xylosifermentans]|uniref:uncharacterized protein n=1 Tax=Scheffersomyces xylosifermentans TaxID=1304137 RepID=UPI00315D1204